MKAWVPRFRRWSFVVAAVALPWRLDAPAAAQSAEELFAPIARVMQHPRCVNCHVKGDAPLNGDEGRPHRMKINRGVDDLGAPAARCYACHGKKASTVPSLVPAAPNWKLAPHSMTWQGLSAAELCRALTDRNGNGNRGPAELLDHMATDKVVGTGWEGGGGRTAVPIPREELVRLMKIWVDAGAPCPER
jgi:cytochrome c553